MGAWQNAFFLQEKPMSVKFLLLGGVLRGGSADLFLRARGFFWTKKTTCLHEHFRKVRVNFSLLSCDTSQEPNGNCSGKLVQVSFFILGGFFRVDFPAVRFDSPTILRIFYSFVQFFLILGPFQGGGQEFYGHPDYSDFKTEVSNPTIRSASDLESRDL